MIGISNNIFDAAVRRGWRGNRGILNQFAGAVFAYSMRRINDNYSGFCVRVRRSSDNTERDIGFGSDGWLDTADLLSFVGAGNGFVTRWYDQSGFSGRTAFQTNAAQQPSIVGAGALRVLNGRPTILSDGVDDAMNIGLFSTFANVPAISTFAVASTVAARATGQRLFSAKLASGEFTRYASRFVENTAECGTIARRLDSDTPIAQIAIAGLTTSAVVITGHARYTLNQLRVGRNLAMGASATYSSGSGNSDPNPSVNNQNLFASSDAGGESLNGRMSEIIIYTTDQFLNNAAIAQNQMTAYNI